MGQEVPQNLEVMAGELAESQHIFHISGGGQAADLHHQRHRRLQPAAAESDQIQVGISNGRQPVQDAVSGYDGYHLKVDG